MLKTVKTHSEAFFTLTIRKSRDLCRSIIGPDVTFIVLSLTKSCQMKRLAGREGGGGEALFEKMLDLYEPAGEDEEGAVNVMISEDMSTDDVLKEVMNAIAKN